MENMRNKPLLIVGCLCFVIGLGVFLYPVFHGWYLHRQAAQSIESFYSYTKPSATQPPEARETEPDAPEEEPEETPYPELLEKAKQYNETLYLENQKKLATREAYEAPGFDLTPYELETDVFAVLKIESIGLDMPVYLGANSSNLAAGAAVMGQTSLPIGGENTNCVIAGHRGWKGADYFKHLPEVKIGDTVTVDNLWETLTYTVTETRLIDSTDFGKIFIQPGKDLLTLFTCDYGANGVKYRYLVICTRTP